LRSKNVLASTTQAIFKVGRLPASLLDLAKPENGREKFGDCADRPRISCRSVRRIVALKGRPAPLELVFEGPCNENG